MIYEQKLSDILAYKFDFAPYFLSSDTISAISVGGTSGLVEVSGYRTTSGQKQYIFVDVSSCTAGSLYTLSCQCTSSSGIKKSLEYVIRVVAAATGISAIPSTGNVSGTYSVILAQSGTSAPTITATLQNSLTGTPVLSRYAEGTFRITLAGAFTENKVTGTTGIFPLLVGNESKVSPPKRISDNIMEFRVYDYADNLVDGFGEVHLTLTTYI